MQLTIKFLGSSYWPVNQGIGIITCGSKLPAARIFWLSLATSFQFPEPAELTNLFVFAIQLTTIYVAVESQDYPY